jgi:hypothetical protein
MREVIAALVRRHECRAKEEVMREGQGSWPAAGERSEGAGERLE